jgi:hypothetical protein
MSSKKRLQYIVVNFHVVHINLPDLQFFDSDIYTFLDFFEIIICCEIHWQLINKFWCISALNDHIVPAP